MSKIFILLFLLLRFSTFAQEAWIEFKENECEDSLFHFKIVDIVKVRGWEYSEKSPLELEKIERSIKRSVPGVFFVDSSGITYVRKFYNKEFIDAYVIIGEINGDDHIYIVATELQGINGGKIMKGGIYDIPLCCKRWVPKSIIWLNLSYRTIKIIINNKVEIFFYGPDYGTYCYSRQLMKKRIKN